ncbi:hypothetical protein [Methanogenium cariaci]|uniref:hypothetical protein n=1 Tax=Methanogenium cariaci TaxID=2197 RepID=UPI00078038F3|nr:hypothetical protein [Methanogenium cariaci]
MELEDLRIVVLDERESGKLTSISADIFEKGQLRLRELYSEAQSVDNFLTDRGSDLMREIDSLKVTLNDISRERFKKILKMAIGQMDTHYVDPLDLRKMIPEEREMYDEIQAAITACRHALIDGASPKRTPVVRTVLPPAEEEVEIEVEEEVPAPCPPTLQPDEEILPEEPELPETAGGDMTWFISLMISNLLWGGLTEEYIVLLKMTWSRFLWGGMRRYFMNAT